MNDSTPPLQLTVADVGAWRAWLEENERTSNGVWLVLARKGTAIPTSLGYAEALDEALCSGWIDGTPSTTPSIASTSHPDAPGRCGPNAMLASPAP